MEIILDEPITIMRKKYMRKDHFKHAYAISWNGLHREGRRYYQQLSVRYKSNGKWCVTLVPINKCVWGHLHYPQSPSKQQWEKINHWIKREERCWERVKTLVVLNNHCVQDGGLHRYICDFVC